MRIMTTSAAHVLRIAVIATCYAAAFAATQHVYNIPTGVQLDKLPGYSLLMPKQQVASIAITQAPVTFRLSDDKGLVLDFTAPGYVTDSHKTAYMFGPTLRLKRGQHLSIRLTNDLLQTEPITNHNTFYGPKDTNLHTHGLYDETGIYDQNVTDYRGGDNIFVVVPAKKTPTDKPASLAFNTHIPEDHLPGMHWYHPHKHGSTTIQASTSHGAIIVDDDPYWLPYNRGLCGHLQAVLATAPEKILDITLLFFKQAEDIANSLDSPTYQYVSNASSPQNGLCCNKKNGHSFGGYATQGQGLDLLIVNGGYKPVIKMADGVWYRWRMLYSGAKGWSTFRIVTTKLQNAPECEWMLISKDGVYMQSIPRKVDAVLMASGNRLEALVRCSLPRWQGTTDYILSATNKNDPFNPGNNKTFSEDFFRVYPDEVARIRVMRPEVQKYAQNAAKYAAQAATLAVKGGKVASSSAATTANAAAAQPAHYFGGMPKFDLSSYKRIIPESCTPRRPSYANDIRDAALAAANYPVARTYKQDVNFIPVDNPQGWGMACSVNGDLFSFPNYKNPLVMPLGEIVQWTTNNGQAHPMHVHGQPMQLVAFNLSNMYTGTKLTNFFQLGDYYDTMLVPQIGKGPGSVVMRFQPGPFSGYAVMHCHYLNHEDLGCMKVVQWKCPGYDRVQPASGRCDTFKFPLPGLIPSYR